jgi:hypothetical protein
MNKQTASKSNPVILHSAFWYTALLLAVAALTFLAGYRAGEYYQLQGDRERFQRFIEQMTKELVANLEELHKLRIETNEAIGEAVRSMLKLFEDYSKEYYEYYWYPQSYDGGIVPYRGPYTFREGNYGYFQQ